MPAYPTGSAILSGFCCKWGQYNTHQSKNALYEAPPVQLFGSMADKRVSMQGYLVSMYVKIASQITDLDYEIYIMDTDMPASEIVSGGLLAVLRAGGYAMAVSDVKARGGTFGYDPPTEELVPIKIQNGAEIIEMKGRPFYKGLAVALVQADDNSVIVETNSLFIDCRYLYSQLDPAGG
jgi:hypothetical protein